MQSSYYLCWKEGPPRGEPHFCFVTQNLRGLAIQYIVKILEILQIWQCNRSRAHSIAELCKVQEAHKKQHYINKSLSSVLSKSWWFWQIMEFMHLHAYTFHRFTGWICGPCSLSWSLFVLPMGYKTAFFKQKILLWSQAVMIPFQLLWFPRSTFFLHFFWNLKANNQHSHSTAELLE